MSERDLKELITDMIGRELTESEQRTVKWMATAMEYQTRENIINFIVSAFRNGRDTSQ